MMVLGLPEWPMFMGLAVTERATMEPDMGGCDLEGPFFLKDETEEVLGPDDTELEESGFHSRARPLDGADLTLTIAALPRRACCTGWGLTTAPSSTDW